MCKRGDIIFVRHYQDGDKQLGQHSFVVLDDEGGNVRGVPYDLIALVMSSIKNDRQRDKKLSYPGNFEVSASCQQVNIPSNGKDAYIKAEQFYYFQKENLDYVQIGSLTIDAWAALLEFIEAFAEKGVQIKQITDNLSTENPDA